MTEKKEECKPWTSLKFRFIVEHPNAKKAQDAVSLFQNLLEVLRDDGFELVMTEIDTETRMTYPNRR